MPIGAPTVGELSVPNGVHTREVRIDRLFESCVHSLVQSSHADAHFSPPSRPRSHKSRTTYHWLWVELASCVPTTGIVVRVGDQVWNIKRLRNGRERCDSQRVIRRRPRNIGRSPPFR